MGKNRTVISPLAFKIEQWNEASKVVGFKRPEGSIRGYRLSYKKRTPVLRHDPK